jgi:hypothetical protein
MSMRQDLTTSQLGFLTLQQHLRDRNVSLEHIFHALRSRGRYSEDTLRQAAMQSQDTAEFLSRIAVLPTHIKEEMSASEFGINTSVHDSEYLANVSLTIPFRSFEDGPSPPITPSSASSYSRDTLINEHVSNLHKYNPEYAHPFVGDHSVQWQPQVDIALSTMMPYDTSTGGDISFQQPFTLMPGEYTGAFR